MFGYLVFKIQKLVQNVILQIGAIRLCHATNLNMAEKSRTAIKVLEVNLKIMDNQNNNYHNNCANMENNKCDSCSDDKKSCHGFMFCHKHCNYKHMIIRGIILFFIIVITFYLGVKVGEFRGEYRGGFQNSYMQGYGMMNDYDDGYYYGMMKSKRMYQNQGGCPMMNNGANTNNNSNKGYQAVPGGMMRINISE